MSFTGYFVGRHTRKTLGARIMAKVVRGESEGCWQWIGGMGGKYGAIHYKGETMPAHRASWTAFRGRIPTGMEVCHHCDNTRCVRPEHLFIGTRGDNVRDMVAKGRGRNHLATQNGRFKRIWVQMSPATIKCGIVYLTNAA